MKKNMKKIILFLILFFSLIGIISSLSFYIEKNNKKYESTNVSQKNTQEDGIRIQNTDEKNSEKTSKIEKNEEEESIGKTSLDNSKGEKDTEKNIIKKESEIKINEEFTKSNN